MNPWISRLLEITSYSPRGFDIEWEPMQEGLGTALPEDFKELAEKFGVGEFSHYLSLFTSDGTDHFSVLGNLIGIRRALARSPEAASVYEPYSVYEPVNGGLLPWGDSVQEGIEFFWLAGEQPVGSWPILARLDPLGDWYRFDMTVSEFIFRMLSSDSLVHPFFVPPGCGAPQFEVY